MTSEGGPGDPRVNGSSALVSPALLLPKEGAAYELKFLLNEATARQVEAWLAPQLALDPHADPALGNAYQIESLYLDTAGRDVLHRRSPHRRRKFRLRRYGASPGVFLERKARWGDRVAKRRGWVPAEEIDRLRQPSADPAWIGHWFHRRLLAYELQPVCQVSCERVAFMGSVEGQPVRATLDRKAHSLLAADWGQGEPRGGVPFLVELVILELKFRSSLPGLFRRLMQELMLNPGPVSKYRLAMQAWGCEASAREVG